MQHIILFLAFKIFKQISSYEISIEIKKKLV